MNGGDSGRLFAKTLLALVLASSLASVSTRAQGAIDSLTVRTATSKLSLSSLADSWTIPLIDQTAGLGRRAEKVAVIACHVRSTTTDYELRRLLDRYGTTTVVPATVAAWANATITSWFRSASKGRYTPTFVAAGEVTLDERVNSRGCVYQAATQLDDSFTSIMAVVDIPSGVTSWGTPGDYTTTSTDVKSPYVWTLLAMGSPLRLAPRGIVLGAYNSSGSGSVAVHELGHALGWPHSFVGPASEYDSRYDVMSAQPVDGCGRTCPVQNTLAINRLASGWIDANEVVTSAIGTESFDLASPTNSGTALVVIPSRNRLRFYSVEARPSTGFDATLPKSGLVVSIVDSEGCPNAPCILLNRRQRPAVGTPFGSEAVLAVGEKLDLGEVTITNVGTTSTGFTARIVHVPTIPNRPTRTRFAFWDFGKRRVSWSPPAFEGGEHVTSYKVTDPNGAVLCETANTFCVVTDTTTTVTVAAANSAGEGDAVTVAYASKNPLSLWATAGNRSVRFAWLSAAPFLRYVVSDESGRVWCRASTTGCTARGLDPTRTYQFRLKVVGVFGQSAEVSRVYAKAYVRVVNGRVDLRELFHKKWIQYPGSIGCRFGPLGWWDLRLKPGSSSCTALMWDGRKWFRVELRR